MSLGARLQAVADFVPAGVTMADIGTDHAYLPIALLDAGRIAAAIACDVNEGPYQVARGTIAAAGRSGEITLRLGNGLLPLRAGEAEIVTIAGMGGSLMRQILEQSPTVLARLQGVVLQPMNAVPQLRRWLYENGWHLEAEALAEEDGRVYEILYAVPGQQNVPEDILLAVGPLLWRDKHPLLKRHVENLLQQERRMLQGMENSERARSSEKYQQTLQRIEALEDKRQW